MSEQEMMQSPVAEVPVAESSALDQYLLSGEGQNLTDEQIGDMFEVRPGDVRRAKLRLKLIEPRAKAVKSPKVPEDSRVPQADSDTVGDAPASSVPQDPSPLPEGLVLGIQAIRIADLDLDLGTRVRPFDEQHVERMADSMRKARSTADFPPLRAMWIPDLERLALWDGYNRHEAASRVFGDDATFAVDVSRGTLNDAIAEAFKANRKNGLPLSTQDRRNIVIQALEHDYWGKWNNKKIAELVGEPHHQFVAEVRKEWEKAKGQDGGDSRTVLTEKDGKVIAQTHPRGRPDASEDSDVSEDQDQGEADTGDPTPAQKQEQAEREYIMAVPMRANLHADLLGSFDKAVIAWLRLERVNSWTKNWLIAQKAILGEDHPLYDAVDQGGHLPAPISQGEDRTWRKQWMACQECLDPNGLTTGQVIVDGQFAPCRKCKGSGIRLPGKR